MTVTDEISYFEYNFGVNVSQNLYVALLLTLIAQRHSLLVSSDLINTHTEIDLIFNKFWLLQANFIHSDKITTLESFIKVLIESSKNYKLHFVYVIVGIENLSEEIQNWIAGLLRKKKFTHDAVNYTASGLFSVFGISDENRIKEKTLKRSIIDQLWIKQPHHPEHPDDPQPLKASSEGKEKIHDILRMNSKLNQITMVPEMLRYTYDIIVFVRNHRCVDTGLPTRLVTELQLLSKAICVIFDREFVIPTIVKLAARKLIPLHIKLIPPELEPSLQWGGDLALAKELMKRVTPELIVEDVLSKISVPI